MELLSQSYTMKLDLLKTFEITLIPKDAIKPLPSYNTKYIIHGPTSGVTLDNKAASVLYGATFKSPNEPEPVIYKVELGLVRVIRGRKNIGKINFL